MPVAWWQLSGYPPADPEAWYDLGSGGHETAFCDMLYENHDYKPE